MSSSKSSQVRSQRLATLHSCYRNEKFIWDIGCDHGQLGLSYIETESVQKIHLVDASLAVIEELKKRTKDSYITKVSLEILNKNGQKLILNSSSNCIFLAGMGGREIGEIILNLLPQLDYSSQIVISPHRKILELRALLHSLDVSLEDECLVYENDKFYQILRLRPKARVKVPIFGTKIWQGEIGKRYLDEQLRFFRNHRDPLSQRYVAFLESLKPLKSSTKEIL